MGGSQHRILLVVDDSEARGAMTEHLKGEGFRVEAAADGKRALDRLDATHPDALVLEWLLPDQDGIEILMAARKRRAGESLPTIMLDVEHPFRDLEVEARGLDVAAVLRKPVEPSTLTDAVKALLGLGEPEEPAVEAPPPDAAEVVEDHGPPWHHLPGGGAAELLHAARASGVTGMLSVRSAGGVRKVYIRDGKPVAVTSTFEGETLGGYLQRAGRLGNDGARALAAASDDREVAQTAQILQQGLLAPHQLHDALRQARSEVLLALFAVEEGKQRFVPGRDWEQDVVPVAMDPARIILDGVTEHYDGARLGDIPGLPDEAWVFLREDASYRDEELHLTTAEARVFAAARQGGRLGDLLRRTKGSRADVERLLRGLEILEVVAFQVGGVPPQVRPTPEPIAAPRRDRPKRKTAEERLAEEHEHLSGADFFEVLGLERDAPASAVHGAFREREPRYRAEAFAEMPEESQQQGEEIHLRLVEAYRVLTDPKRRVEYVDDLADGQTDMWDGAVKARINRSREAAAEREVAAHEAAKAARAEREREDARMEARAASQRTASGEMAEAITQAQEELEGGRPRAAIMILREVLQTAPEEPLLKGWLGWALFKHAPDKFAAEAAALLESAVETGPPRPEPYLFLARVSEHLGAYDTASDMYSQASAKDPTDMEIKREAHLFLVRAKKRPKRKGGKPTPPPRAATPGSAGKAPSPASGGDSAWSSDLGSLVKGIFGKKS